jgi:hypothetical protein
MPVGVTCIVNLYTNRKLTDTCYWYSKTREIPLSSYKLSDYHGNRNPKSEDSPSSIRAPYY